MTESTLASDTCVICHAIADRVWLSKTRDGVNVAMSLCDDHFNHYSN
jgi:hypothetical protein